MIVGAGFTGGGSGASRQDASTSAIASHRIVTSIALALAACDDSGSGFTGDYETVAVVGGACGEPGDVQPIDDDLQWFQLADVATETGLLVGYFPCVAPGDCLADHDLYRSFGRATVGTGWETTIATALQPGCTLRFRVRTLARVDDAQIRVAETVYEQVDPALTGAACSMTEARARGTSMPCVAASVLTAEHRAF